MNVVPVEDITRALLDERARLRAAHEGGSGGLDLARALSAAMDRAIAALWERVAGDEPGSALVALGGYGRGELSPFSDVDLMILHGGSKRVAGISQRLFYALWDHGFAVGHATRTLKESLRLARENLEAETSFLQPRLIAGDPGLFAEFEEATLRATRKRTGRFVREVRAMMRARHATGGSATSQLEPNIKEGAGGLRDLHVLGWFERVVGDLGQAGLVGSRERARLDDAAEMLHRVRNHLHYTTGRPTDVLLFEHQRPIARFLCYLEVDRPAEDAFMRDLFAATRTVEHVVSAVVAELSAPPARARRSRRAPSFGGSAGAGRSAHAGGNVPRAGGDPAHASGDECFGVEGGRVVLLRQPDLTREPERALELFALGAEPGAGALRWLGGALPPVLPWTDGVRRAFFRLLRTGDARALEVADHAGVFGALLPEWAAVRCQPQHNVYHRFTVDAHLFNTVAHLRALAGDASDPMVRDVWADVADPDGLLLAGLLHDVGKGTDEDHAVRGERLALAVCDRMGVAEPRREVVAWLVRHHLLLVEAATRRDLNDENLIVDVASRIGDGQRARMLFLLSVADGRATGPAAWSPWKAALVTELFTKTLHVIERGELVSRDAVDLVRLRTTELREALTRHPPEAVEAHLTGMPRAYLLAFPTTELIRHFALMDAAAATGDARAHAAPTEDPEVYEYTVAVRDRPGLFATVSGALALNGVNIVGAQGFTRADGIAVEVFRCVGAFEPSIDGARWERVTEDVGWALEGRSSLELRLAEKREAYGRKAAKAKRSAPKVIVDDAASDFLTVVEVHAPDRVGLLYDITKTFADLSLDIQVAKVATYGEDVVDVFYVRDLDGQKVADPERVAELERTLLHRLTDTGR